MEMLATNELLLIAKVAAHQTVARSDLLHFAEHLPDSDWGDRRLPDLSSWRYLAFVALKQGEVRESLHDYLTDHCTGRRWDSAIADIVEHPANVDLLRQEVTRTIRVPGKRLNRRRTKAILGALGQTLDWLQTGELSDALSAEEAALAAEHLTEHLTDAARPPKYLLKLRLPNDRKGFDGPAVCSWIADAQPEKCWLVTNPIGRPHAVLILSTESSRHAKQALSTSGVTVERLPLYAVAGEDITSSLHHLGRVLTDAHLF